MNMGQGRCYRATRYLNAHEGSVKARTKGTIEFEINNLGRRLIIEVEIDQPRSTTNKRPKG